MDTVTYYYEDIRTKSKVITREEEIELFKRYNQGDEAAGQKLIEANLRFVISIANQYTNSGLPLADLISEGNIGLMKALEMFDHTKGYKFISYAVWWIRQHIMTYVKEDHVVRRPINIHDAASRTARAQQEISQRLERDATPQDVAEHLDMDIDKVVHALTCHHDAIHPDGSDALHIENLVEQEPASRIDQIVEDDQRNRIIKEIIKEVLTEREQYVVMKSFGFDGSNGMTLDKIGRSLGLTRERIRQIREVALLKLRTRPQIKRMGLPN